MRNVRKILVAFLMLCITMVVAFPVFANESSISLENMHELKSEAAEFMEDAITDSYGNKYGKNILRLDAPRDAYVSYDLNGAYEKFEGSIVASTDTSSDAVMNVCIYGDGELLYELKNYTKQKAAEEVSIDVSGVGTLSIMTTGSGNYGYVYFVYSSFTKSESVSLYPNRACLSDLVVIDSKNCETSERLFADTFGNSHKGWTKLSSWCEPYILYNLDKKYVSLSGCIVCGNDTGSNVSMNIKMYLDDREVFSQENIMKNSPQIDFDLDVSNASVLKIVAAKNEGDSAYIYVADSILKAHEHTPGDWVVQKEATCTEAGEKVQICTECQEVVASEKIAPTGHKAERNWTVTKEATCTEDGEQVRKCSICGEAAETEVIKAKGHVAGGSWEYGDDGTCNKVKRCSVCGEVALRQSDDEAEHTPSGEWVVTREARCNAEGEQVQYCTVCNQICQTEAIPTTDHEYGEWTTLSGSIWNTPIVKERVCSVCGEVDHVESNSTSWLKPLVIAVIVIVLGVFAVICVTLKMNGLPLAAASVKKLFSKESLNDEDIDDILKKKDKHSDQL